MPPEGRGAKRRIAAAEVASSPAARALFYLCSCLGACSCLLGSDQASEVVQRLSSELGINLQLVQAEARFLEQLKGVDDPERKRKIIGGLFIDCFQAEALKIDRADFLLQVEPLRARMGCSGERRCDSDGAAETRTTLTAPSRNSGRAGDAVPRRD